MSEENKQAVMPPPPAVALPEDSGKAKSGLEIVSDEFVEEMASEWPAIDERPALPPLPQFPIDAMPGILKKMTIEITPSVQVAPEVAALTILIATGFAAGRENVLHIKRGLETRPNLFGLIFVERGGRKSASYAPILKPFYQWIATRLEAHKLVLNSLRLKQKESDSLETIMTSVKVKPDVVAAAKDKYDRLQTEIEDMRKKLRDPAFVADDITPEALFSLFERCHGQGFICSDDGRSFVKILNGHIYSCSGESREEFHLRGYDCNNPLIKHRAGKPTAVIVKPFESALVMLQMDFLEKMAVTEALFCSGYLSRCIFCVPDSLAGARLYSERQINETIAMEYENFIKDLLDSNYSKANGEDLICQVEPSAKDLWIKFYNQTETEIGSGGKFYEMADLAIRFPEFARRIALIIAIVERHDTVTGEDMSRAILLTEYYSKHSERAFAVMKEISLPGEAQRILRTITKKQLLEFSLRDIERTTGMTATEAEAGVNLLCSRNYVRAKQDQLEREGAGRKASVTYETNPATFLR